VLQRSILSGLFLGVAIPVLCLQALAQDASKEKGTHKQTQDSPPKQVEKPPASREEQIYQQAKNTLTFFEKDLLHSQETITSKLAGRQCEHSCCEWGCDPPHALTKEEVEKFAFRKDLAGVREELKNVEAEHQELKGKVTASPCTECEVFYHNVVDGAQHYWPGQSWLTIANHVLFVSAKRVDDRLNDERKKLEDELGRNENLSSKQRDAKLAELDLKQSKVREEVFNEVAKEFEGYVHLLSDDRKNLVVQLWHMYDLAEADHYEEGKEIIMGALKEWDKETLNMSGQLYFGIFADASGDTKYDWCKKPSYPDIEERDSKSPCNKLLTDVMKQPSIKDLHQKESVAAKTPAEPANCKLRLTYSPSVLTVTALRASPILEFRPPGCKRPKPEPVAEYSIAPTSDEGAVRLVDNQNGKVEWGKPGTATIVVRVGSLDTFAIIQVEDGPCQSITMAGFKDRPLPKGLNPQLGVGESSQMEIDYAPPGCTIPTGDLNFSSDKPKVLRVDSQSERTVTVTGVSYGFASIQAEHAVKPGAQEVIRGGRVVLVELPSCTELRLKYPNSTVKTDTDEAQLPALGFLPEGCKKPQEPPKYELTQPKHGPYNLRFSESTGSFIPLGSEEDVIVSVTVGPIGKSLSASATVKVEPGHCERFTLELAKKSTMKFGNSEYPAVMQGSRAQLLVAEYGPKGCSPPMVARLDLRPDDHEVFIVDPQASDVLIAKKLGHTTVRATQSYSSSDHARVDPTGRLEIYVVPHQDCTRWSLAILPDSIIVGETAQARLTGEPEGCFDLESSPWIRFNIEDQKVASGGGESNKITGLAEGTTKIYATEYSKPYPTVAILKVKAQPACEKLELHYGRATVAVDELGSEPRVTYSPDHCKPPDPDQVRKWFSGAPSERAEVNYLTGAVTGIAPGKFDVTVNQKGVESGTTTVQITPPQCKNLQVTYSPRSIHLPSETASPTTYYSPFGCVQPEVEIIDYFLDSDPKFKVDTDIATVDRNTGVIKGNKVGTAHINVSRGNLTTTASVEILPPR
jgi:hypothetical protein